MTSTDLVLRTRLPLSQHPAAVYLASLQPGSRPGQRSALNKIAQIFDTTVEMMSWSTLRYPHIQMIRTILSERYSPITTNKMLVALRRVLKEAWLLDQIPEGEYRKLSAIQSIKVITDDTDAGLSGRALESTEIDALFKVCDADTSPFGVRDGAIIALGYGLGMRRVEILRADLKDYKPSVSLFEIQGKGNRLRILPLQGGAAQRLEKWIALRGSAPGPLFCVINSKTNSLIDKRLMAQGVHDAFERRVLQSNIPDADFHDLRRTFITDLLAQGVDLATVCKLAGHTNPKVTLKYDRRHMESRRKAIAVLSIPNGI